MSTRSYPLFSHLVETASNPDSAMQTCRIFVDAAQGEPTSGGKISLNQSQAVKQWDALLQGLSPKDQVPTIQAIAPFDPYQMVAEWIALRHEVKQQRKLLQISQTTLQQALERLEVEKADLQQQLAASQSAASRAPSSAQLDQKALCWQRWLGKLTQTGHHETVAISMSFSLSDILSLFNHSRQ